MTMPLTVTCPKQKPTLVQPLLLTTVRQSAGQCGQPRPDLPLMAPRAGPAITMWLVSDPSALPLSMCGRTDRHEVDKGPPRDTQHTGGSIYPPSSDFSGKEPTQPGSTLKSSSTGTMKSSSTESETSHSSVRAGSPPSGTGWAPPTALHGDSCWGLHTTAETPPGLTSGSASSVLLPF